MSLIFLNCLVFLALANLALPLGLRVCLRIPPALRDPDGDEGFWLGVRIARRQLWHCIGYGVLLWLLLLALDNALY